MSSSGTILATTPLFPWRPAILSPTDSLRLRGDVNFDRLDDAGIDFVAGFDAFHGRSRSHLQFGELLFVRLPMISLILLRIGLRIDLDAIVNRRQLAQQRLGDLAIGRNDDFAGLGVYDVERNFFAEQNVRKRFGQLLAQLVFLLPVLFSRSALSCRFGFGRREFLARDFACRDETFTSMTMP